MGGRRLKPRLRPVPRKDRYLLLDDFRIQTRWGLVVVPKLFRYDGASIPRIGWQLTYTPFHPDVMLAALVHDWLYLSHQFSKETADLIFKDLLLESGVSETKAWIMYQAVKLGGGCAWKQSRDDKKKLRRLWKINRWRDHVADFRFPAFVTQP